MGLFKKKAETRAEIETMRAELRTMRQRLDHADSVKAGLAERIGKLDAENQRLNSQVGSVESNVETVKSQVVTVATSIDNAVGKAATVDSVATLRGDIARLGGLAARLDELGTAVQAQAAASEAALPAPTGPAVEELATQLADLARLIDEQQQQLADVALVATDSAERTAQAETAVAGLAERDLTPRPDDDLRHQLGQLAEKVSAIDSRVNQISVELTNQLSELSGELDASRQAPAAADTKILDELEQLMSARIDTQLNDITDGQERLANEQARYAIQFRQDLAELADRLRRPNAH